MNILIGIDNFNFSIEKMDQTSYTSHIYLGFLDQGLASMDDQEHLHLVRVFNRTPGEIAFTIIWPLFLFSSLFVYFTAWLIHLLLLPFTWPILLLWVYNNCNLARKNASLYQLFVNVLWLPQVLRFPDIIRLSPTLCYMEDSIPLFEEPF